MPRADCSANAAIKCTATAHALHEQRMRRDEIDFLTHREERVWGETASPEIR